GRVADNDQPALRAWNRAANGDQVALGVNAHHNQVLRGLALVAHTASHTLALGHARHLRGRADRARGAPTVRLPVRLHAAGETMALHIASKPAALCLAHHVNLLANLELSYRQLLADAVVAGAAC